MMNLPIKTILGDLVLENTFEFYDIPRLFTCKSRVGVQYLVLSTYDDYENFEWLYLPISNDRLGFALHKGITLREIYLNPEDGYLFQVTSDLEGKSNVKSILPESIPNEDLPEKDIYLIANEKVKIGFGVINAKDAARMSGRETFNIHLTSMDMDMPEAEIKPLGNTLTTFQVLIDSLGEYCNGDPSLQGRIPVELLNQTKINATQIFYGSFGLQLKSSQFPKMFKSSLISDAFLELNNLIEAKDDEDNISNKLHQLKGRVSSAYKAFLYELIKLDSPLEIDWGSPIQDRGGELYIRKDILKNTYKIVSRIDTEISESVFFTAELLGLDVKVKRFRVRHLEDDVDYTGNISPECMDEVRHSEINANYKVNLKKLIETDWSSGKEKIKWVLFGLEGKS